MITVKGELTDAERKLLAELRAHTAEVNQREYDANLRGMVASLSITPKPLATHR